MSASINALLARIPDEALRAELAAAIAEANSTTEFGLVFEKHLPETVRLPHHPIRRGVKVANRDDPKDRSVFHVVRITNGMATVRRRAHPDGTAVDRDAEPEVITAAVDTLVVLAEFGDAIYPGLKRLGSIEGGGDKPSHVVINAENHHALEMLRFTHAGKIDCIYIDPPYNTGARDWQYDNDYVDGEDAYRHSKWLAFMARRLRLARELLSPNGSVLIVTIDEKEYLRLGLLLEQIFTDAVRQMVTVVINPLGQARKQEFGRVEEYAFFLFVGSAVPATATDDMLSNDEPGRRRRRGVRWEWLLRGGTGARRADRPNLFFPIFIDRTTRTVVEVGEALPPRVDRTSVPDRPGCVTVWPLSRSGSEARWRASPPYLRELLVAGHAKVGAHDAVNDRWTLLYLGKAQRRRIENGELKVVGRDAAGAVVVDEAGTRTFAPKTVWNRTSHRSGEHGTSLLKRFLPDRTFPFPKSLYAVEDTVRVAVGDKPDAVVLDFFAGSGTTAHAVARLNRQDGGRRQAILVTNNEVSVDEASTLTEQGFRDGDPEWEALGIFEHIARPRITAAITGLTPDGEPVKGDYKFTDEFPMAEGFEENVEFLELTYQDVGRVELDRAFNAIAPMLWLRAGAKGPVIEECHDSAGKRISHGWTDRYGVLFDTDRWSTFVSEMPESATAAFIVTDSSTTFSQISGELPGYLDTVRLYERYLTTFAINMGAS